jgi:hypothetical protein
MRQVRQAAVQLAVVTNRLAAVVRAPGELNETGETGETGCSATGCCN